MEYLVPVSTWRQVRNTTVMDANECYVVRVTRLVNATGLFTW